MTLTRPPRLIGTVFLLTASIYGCNGSSPDRATNTLTLKPCSLFNLEETLQCGTYEVWENRSTREGRKIPLRVVVMPATGDHPAPDPIIFFAGGPGGSTVEMAPGLAFAMAEAHERRDFVLVDYRGTGESAPLFCDYQLEPRGIDEALETFLPIDELAACRDALSARADLTQ